MDYYDLLLANKLNGGGGGGGGYTADDLATRNYTGDMVVTGGILVDAFSSSHITSLTADNMSGWIERCCYNCSDLESVSMKMADRLQTSCFENCTSLKYTDFPNMKHIGTNNVFKGCTSLETIKFPKGGELYNYVPSGFGSEYFSGCTSLKKVEGWRATSIGGSCFNGCVSLEVLVLRGTNMASLSNVNAFANMNGKAVDVYVPSSLVSTYQSGTNWVNVTGATLTFKAIEGSFYETHYADGTEIGA